MVKQLLKHEFIYYIRTFGLFLPIVLAMGVMTKVCLLLNNETLISTLAISSSVMMLAVSCFALMLMASFIGIVRFYKNMYGAEGYLTLTLPVSHAQHIFVKLFVALVAEAACLLTVILSVLIAGSGEALSELLAIFGEAFRELPNVVGVPNALAYIIEILLLVVFVGAGNMLLFYACITIGQLAKKNRILLAIGAYFIYYMATQVLGTVFTILFAMLSETYLMKLIFEWAVANPIPAVHIYFFVSILISAAMAAVFWIITQWIMSKKLNLE